MENMIGLYGELYDKLSGLADNLVNETAETVIGEHNHTMAMLSSSIYSMKAKDMKIRKSLSSTKARTIIFVDVQFKTKVNVSDSVQMIDVPNDVNNDWFLQHLGIGKDIDIVATNTEIDSEMTTDNTLDKVENNDIPSSGELVNSIVRGNKPIEALVTEEQESVANSHISVGKDVNKPEITEETVRLNDINDVSGVDLPVIDDNDILSSLGVVANTEVSQTLVTANDTEISQALVTPNDTEVIQNYENVDLSVFKFSEIDLSPLLKEKPLGRICYPFRDIDATIGFDTTARANDLVSKKYDFYKVVL